MTKGDVVQFNENSDWYNDYSKEGRVRDSKMSEEEILNKYIELIDKGYCEDCNELNCLGNFPHKEIAKNIKLILEENKKYKEVINKIDKVLKEVEIDVKN